MRRRVTSWLLVASIAMLAAAAAHATGPPLDVATYRARANAICRAFGHWSPPAGSASKQLTALTNQFRSVVESLTALEPPPTLVRLRKQVVDVLHDEEAFLAKELALFKAGKITPLQFETDVGATSYTTM